MVDPPASRVTAPGRPGAGPATSTARLCPCPVPLDPTTCIGCASRPSRACPRTGDGPSSRSQTVAPTYDGYRQALWLVPTDPGADGPPRQLTIGARNDHHPRFSPDGRTLAFISDRRLQAEEEPARPKDCEDREDKDQVHLLPIDGPGEARRLTDLPRGVEAFEWSPDGRRLVVVSTSHGATHDEDARRRARRRKPTPERAARLRLPVHRPAQLHAQRRRVPVRPVRHLWLVDVASGAATRLTDGTVSDLEPAWSPDGTRIAFVSERHRDHDLAFRPAIHVVDVATRAVHAVTAGPRSMFGTPAWLPDGQTIAALGTKLEGRGGSRNDVWLFPADGSEAHADGGRNLSGRHDLMPGSGVASDVVRGETARLRPSPDGRSIDFPAPIDGSYELWRIAVADGAVRAADDRSAPPLVVRCRRAKGRRTRYAYLRSTPTAAARPVAQRRRSARLVA